MAGTPYLAGSNQGLATGVGNLMAAVSWPIAEVLGTVTRNPALLLGRSPARTRTGPARDLVIFRHGAPDEFILTRTVVDGVGTNRLPEGGRPCRTSSAFLVGHGVHRLTEHQQQ